MPETYTNCHVFKDGRFIAMDLEVVDGRIASPGSTDALEPTVVDLAGAYILPGLIDAHAHMVLSTDAKRDDSHTSRILKGVRNASDQLSAGVTSVRDVGGPGRISIELAEAIDAGVLEGPRIWSSGSFICATGGHVHYWGREADGADDVRRAVREQRKDGSSFIKLMASGGVADPRELPEQCQFTPVEIAAACDEARRSGTYVSAHAHPAEAINQCLTAGVRTIEHASFMDDASIDLALAKEAYIVPTFIVYAVMASAEHLSRQQRELAAGVLDRKSESFLRAMAAGVSWGVGTDAGSFMQQGQLWQEMRYLQKIGVPSSSILEAATATNAKILQQPGIGRLDPGCWADLLVVSNDPTIDVSVLREPTLVVKAGRKVSSTPTQAAKQQALPI